MPCISCYVPFPRRREKSRRLSKSKMDPHEVDIQRGENCSEGLWAQKFGHKKEVTVVSNVESLTGFSRSFHRAALLHTFRQVPKTRAGSQRNVRKRLDHAAPAAGRAYFPGTGIQAGVLPFVCLRRLINHASPPPGITKGERVHPPTTYSLATDCHRRNASSFGKNVRRLDSSTSCPTRAVSGGILYPFGIGT